MAEKWPYPAREHYDFPRNQIEQAQEELKIYIDPNEMRANIIALHHMYEKTAFMQSMKQYSAIAGSLKIKHDAEQKADHDFNFDFYGGTVLATHINLAPADLDIKRSVLSKNLLTRLNENPHKESIVENIENYLAAWSGGEEDNWFTFLSEQEPSYQDTLSKIALRLYEDQKQSAERELDFMIGAAFASDLVWQIGTSTGASAPV